MNYSVDLTAGNTTLPSGCNVCPVCSELLPPLCGYKYLEPVEVWKSDKEKG
jgi:hypothetical protein